MTESNFNKDAFLLGMALAQTKEPEELEPSMKFLTDLVKANDGNAEKKDFMLPWGWDDPDTGMGEIENVLCFIDEVLQDRPAEISRHLGEYAQAGVGSICRMLSMCLRHYRNETFNMIDELQRVYNRQNKQTDNQEQEVSNE